MFKGAYTNVVFLLRLFKQCIFLFVHFNNRDKEMKKNEKCDTQLWIHVVVNIPVEKNDLF